MGVNESGKHNLTAQRDLASNSPDTGAGVIPLRRSRAIGFPKSYPL